ncbi:MULTISPECIES: hypothetical protein [Rhizobium/Agrobacterium group]|uniref:Uncharacterized protein n=2 Tax=Rhizobium/Agrobacterium group TaxID=227290 RepID=B9K1W3_ALLAM|nr:MULTISPECIES: hypothetical protein [Rhizobium/Agrobacterium group]ACM38861.1 hypothetical protein Avi_5800 [Allorhizobium ampelinum S4]MCF1446029.1 hypothetical protein [Allorhizobium ampelinum]MCF1490979.1 hypothetical protein [Allorhizobium ampelinum]MUO26440.1 hypothetical protein [Agrobacterium vitis]MUO44380.1 hypothetical protein [Agrobacterium vitis]
MPEFAFDDYYDVAAVGIPTAFSIVWCRFPYQEQPDKPGQDLRPCLVRRSFKAEIECDGKKVLAGLIETVYGTKQIDKFPPPRGFHIHREEDKQELGLIYDTVFQLDNVLRLAWTRSFFGPDKSGKLHGKRLNKRLQDELKAQWLEFVKR